MPASVSGYAGGGYYPHVTAFRERAWALVGAAGLLVGSMGTAAVMLSGAVGILILSVRMSRRLPGRSA